MGGEDGEFEREGGSGEGGGVRGRMGVSRFCAEKSFAPSNAR